MLITHKFLCAITLILVSMSAMGADFVGRVVGVSDGDTITVLIDGHERVKVRLVGIDAPEKSQPFGAMSKKNLSNQVFEKYVTVEWEKKDKYGRVLGRILVSGTDVCLEQIRAGLAWHYKQYAKEQAEGLREAYADAEMKARNQKIGIWSEPDPTAPWEYRHSKPLSQIKQLAN